MVSILAWLGLAALAVGAPQSGPPAVWTYRYDAAHSGVNTSEVTLTPANVNANDFGRLFSYAVDGQVYAQPLYLPSVDVPNKGVHNVVFVATEHDSVYAFDADSNAGPNATPLWHTSFINPAAGITTIQYGDTGSDDIDPEIGITGTPVIDRATGTLYVVAKTKENGSYFQRLHALDVATGAEKFGGPVALQASVPGTGEGSVGGVVSYSALRQHQRPALTLTTLQINGAPTQVLLIASAAHGDVNPYHGWVLAYNPSTLQLISAYNTTANGTEGGIWMSGAGPVVDTDGSIYVVSGNGTFDVTPNPRVNLGDSIIKLSLASGAFSVLDYFTPFNQEDLSFGDDDLGTGGVLLLPDQPGLHPRILVQGGKEGTLYVVDRDNLGKFSTAPNDPQIVQFIPHASVGGIFTTATYWNSRVYFWGNRSPLQAFALSNGKLVLPATNVGPVTSGFPAPTPVVTANGTIDALVWALKTEGSATGVSAVLYAFDPATLATLYASSTNATRDSPGVGVKFTLPAIVNGKAYVATQNALHVYGLLNGVARVATPVISPVGGTFDTPQQVSITDTTAGARIYYTTDGQPPTAASSLYIGPITIGQTSALKAIATADGLPDSLIATATFTLQATAPVLSPVGGSFASAPSVTMSTTTPNATIFYTTDGNTPTSGSSQYTGAVQLSQTTTIKARAIATGLDDSPVTSATYAVQASAPTFSVPGAVYNNVQSVALSDTTPGAIIYYTLDGTLPTTASSQYASPIAITQTATLRAIAVAPALDASPVAAATYTLVAATPTFSIAPGVYTDPQLVGLQSATSNAVIRYTLDGTTPTALSPIYTAPISIASLTTIKAIAMLTGFTNSGVASGTFTISSTSGTVSYGTGFVAGELQLNGPAAIVSARLRLTNGGGSQASSAFFKTPVNVENFTNDFSILLTSAVADGMTFTIQGNGLTSVGPLGGGLGYGPEWPNGTPPGIPKSVAVKFDLYNNEGEGTNSTGLYLNGASPTTPFVTLTGSGIDLHNGHVFNVHMDYDGVTLAMTITDASNTALKFTRNYTVNIPAAVGGSFGYVGFTAGTGGDSATQDVLTWTYQPGGVPGQTASPIMAPPAGTYSAAQTVTLSDSTPNASIYYTLDGSTPTSASTPYLSAIPIAQSATLKAIAVASGLTDSLVASGTYTLQPAAPVFSPAAGTYTSAQSVTISDATPGATIYYTTDNSVPTTSSPIYSGPIAVNQTTTLRAMAAIPGWSPSAAVTATYTLNLSQAATPTFSPVSGTYSTVQTVTISDATPGVTIYYTLNNSTPTTASAQYTAPLIISQTTTVKAMAAGPGRSPSAVATATYTLRPAAPALSPGSATYNVPQSVTLTSTTPGAAIYYTTNGSTPTTSSTLYTGPVGISQTLTLRALAAIPGWTNSTVTAVTYTMRVGTPTASPGGGTYSQPQTVTLSSVTPDVTFRYTTNGNTPNSNSTLYTGPIAITQTRTLRAIALRSGWTTSSTSASYVYTMVAATPTFSLPAGTYVGPQTITISGTTPGVTLRYTTNGSTPTSSSAQYTGPILISQTTTLRVRAYLSGWTTSSTATALFTIQ